MKKYLLILLFVVSVYQSFAQSSERFVDFVNAQHGWVDSVFNQLTPEERIAQLLMVRAHSNLGQKYIDSVAGVIKKEQLGGIVLFQGGPTGHAQVINSYQRLSKVPLLVALDGEWGLGMRMPDSTVSYPYQMTLGAVQDEKLIYAMGRQIGQDFRRLGMHVNFAPVVDVNNNPDNPVINFRSFGEDKYNVTRKGNAYMKGMMDEGIIVSIKHFPGHGDTDVDSHHDLPVLPFSADRLDSLEMYPFHKLIKEGASGVMVAHMHIPGLDDTPNLPSSISKPIVTDILKERLGFRGLVFTDAMGMKGVVKFFPDGQADIMAIQAGNDILELSENSARAIGLIQQAIAAGEIDQAGIDQRVKKVLAAKYWLGLNDSSVAEVKTAQLYRDLNRQSSVDLVAKLAESAVTLLNSDRLLNKLDRNRRTAIVSVGQENKMSEFQHIVGGEFMERAHFLLSGDSPSEELAAVERRLGEFDQIILSIHDTRIRPRNQLPFNGEVVQFIGDLAKRGALICFFANPYAIDSVPGIVEAKSLLVCYQNDGFMQRAAAKVVLGEIAAKGRLPVSVNGVFKSGDGVTP